MKNNNDLTPSLNPKDLSETSLKKAVLKKATGSVLFQYPLFACLGCVAIGVLFGMSFPLGIVVFLLTGTSGASWITDMFVRDEKIKLEYILQLKEQAKVEIERKQRQLRSDLTDINLNDAAMQLEQFQNNYKNFMYILDQKFSPEELAYNRYSVIVQQIVLGGMNNLQTIFLRKKNLTDSNPGDIQKTLKTLQKVTDPNGAQKERMGELQKRLDMYKEEAEAIDGLLTQNEKALSAIDNVSRSITSINTDSNLSVNMESAMQDLIEMTDFAKVLDSNYHKEKIEVK